MPDRTKTVVDQSGGEYRVSLRRRAWGASIFLMLWLAGWTVGCVFLAHAVLTQQNWFMLLFALPFWSAWVFVFLQICKMLFQREELVLGSGGVALTKNIFFYTYSTVTKDWKEIQKFQAYKATSHHDSDHASQGIEVQTLGEPVHCFEGLPQQELHWLAHQLNEQLQVWRRPGSGPLHAMEPSASVTAEISDEHEEQVAERKMLSLDRRAPSRPSDCRWTESEDFDQFSFQRRGRLVVAGVLGMLFINAFWNGIVGVFVAYLWGFAPNQKPPVGIEWWGLFAFLIPFQVIGAVILFGLLATLLEPLHKSRWTFFRDRIELRHSWLGVDRRRTWPVEQLNGVELRRELPSQRKAQRGRPEQPRLALISQFSLAFIDSERHEVCAISNLTEGEARWMGQTILQKRPTWFRSNRF